MREIDEELINVETQLKFGSRIPPGPGRPGQYPLLRKQEALLEQKKLVSQLFSQAAEPVAKAIVPKPTDQGKEAGQEGGKHKSISPSEKRALTIERVITELSILKPQMYGESDYQRLNQENPSFLTFEVAAKRADLKIKVLNLLDHQQYYRLAFELAAAHHDKQPSTLKTDWKKHKPKEFRRKSS